MLEGRGFLRCAQIWIFSPSMDITHEITGNPGSDPEKLHHSGPICALGKFTHMTFKVSLRTHATKVLTCVDWWTSTTIIDIDT